MNTFKAKKAKSKYKSTNSWLDAIYRNNKEIIDKELGGTKAGAKNTFKAIINEYVDKGYSYSKALSTLARSTTFTPREERLKNNLWAGLKGDKAAYKEFRELTKEKGKYTKFDRESLRWDKAQKMYIYNNAVMISFKNSPFGIEVVAV